MPDATARGISITRYNEEGLFWWAEGRGREGFPGGVLRSRGFCFFAFCVPTLLPSQAELCELGQLSQGELVLKAFSWRWGAWELVLGPCKGSQPHLHLGLGSPLLQAGHHSALPTSWSLEKPPGYDVGEGFCALQDVVTPPAW